MEMQFYVCLCVHSGVGWWCWFCMGTAGYIGLACWHHHAVNIMTEFPNIICVSLLVIGHGNLPVVSFHTLFELESLRSDTNSKMWSQACWWWMVEWINYFFHYVLMHTTVHTCVLIRHLKSIQCSKARTLGAKFKLCVEHSQLNLHNFNVYCPCQDPGGRD